MKMKTKQIRGITKYDMRETTFFSNSQHFHLSFSLLIFSFFFSSFFFPLRDYFF